MTSPNTVDITNQDPKYWDKVLRSQGLGMDAGLDHNLIYVGDSSDLERIEGRNYRKRTGRVRPSGHGPDA